MSRQLRIELARSGGYAGHTLRSSVDTGELDPQEAEAVESMVDEVDWASLPGAAPRPGAADRFSYHLTITGPGQENEVLVGEKEMTPALRRLVDDVLARRSRPS